MGFVAYESVRPNQNFVAALLSFAIFTVCFAFLQLLELFPLFILIRCGKSLKNDTKKRRKKIKDQETRNQFALSLFQDDKHETTYDKQVHHKSKPAKVTLPLTVFNAPQSVRTAKLFTKTALIIPLQMREAQILLRAARHTARVTVTLPSTPT